MHRSFVSAIALLLLTEAPDVNAATQKTIAPTVYETPRPTEPTEALTPAPTPCGNRPYYIIAIDGVTKCSNGYDANTSESFNSLHKCCNAAGFDNGLCKYIDVCNPTDEPPTREPTLSLVSPAPTVRSRLNTKVFNMINVFSCSYLHLTVLDMRGTKILYHYRH